MPKKLSLLRLYFWSFLCWLALGWGQHALILGGPERWSARAWHDLLPGLGYDLQIAFLGSLVFFLLTGWSPWRFWGVGLGVGAYGFFTFVDYTYFTQFGTHLPFSTLEYLGQTSALSSSITGSLFSLVFVLFGLLPLLVFALAWPWLRLPARRKPRRGVLNVLLVLAPPLLGLVGGSYANSRLGKDLNNPLTSNGLFYFHWSKSQTQEETIAKPEAALQLVGDYLQGQAPMVQGWEAYPLVRVKKAQGCRSSQPSALALALCGKNPRPNLILVLMESMRAWEIGAYGSNLGLTPQFDRWAKKGILFKNFYANGFQTRHGELASYCSLIPNYGLPAMTHYQDRRFFCLPQALKEVGYKTSWVHGADAAFDGQVRFLPKIGFEQLQDILSLPAEAPRLGWGVDDHALFDHWLAFLDQQPQPFFSSALTITNHHPFAVPASFQPKGKSDQERYQQAMAYVDHALGQFLDNLASKPWYQNSLVLITADTSNFQEPMQEPQNFPEFVRLRSQIPLLILGGQVQGGLVVEAAHSQVDLAPTLMDLLGVDLVAPWVGWSMLAENHAFLAFTNRPGNYWAVVGPKGGVYREGSDKNHFEGMTPAEAAPYLNLGEAWIPAIRWSLQQNLIWPPQETLQSLLPKESKIPAR